MIRLLATLGIAALTALTSLVAYGENSTVVQAFWGGYCTNGNGFCLFAYDDNGARWLQDPFENFTRADDNTSDGSMVLTDWTDPSTGRPMTATYANDTIRFSNGLSWAGPTRSGRPFTRGKCTGGMGVCVVFFQNGEVTGVLTEAREYSDATFFGVNNGQRGYVATRWNRKFFTIRETGLLRSVVWEGGGTWEP